MKVKEYAAVMGLHPESVRRLIRLGEIPATQKGREWEIDDNFVNKKLHKEARFVDVSQNAYLMREVLLKERYELYRHLALMIGATSREVRNVYGKYDDRPQAKFIEEMEYILNGGNGLLETLEKIEKNKTAVNEIEYVADLTKFDETEKQMEAAKKEIMKLYGGLAFWGDTPPGAKDED